MRRSVLYVDGFNFYYGTTKFWHEKNEHWAGLGWCDFRALIERHFDPGMHKLEIKYFTAPVYFEHETPGHEKDEHKRYANWSRAVRTIPGIKIVEGFYKTSRDRRVPGEVRNPDALVKSREEKQSDVNLTIEVLLDAMGSEPPDRVFILSDDRDLMPVIFALLERLPVPIPVTVLLPSEADKTKWMVSYKLTADRLVDCGAVPRRPFIREPVVELLTQDILASSLLPYNLQDHGGMFECLQQWQLNTTFLKKHCRNPAWLPGNTDWPVG